MIDPKCDKCKEELTAPGALLLSPPLPPLGRVVKRHVCWPCYSELDRWMTT